MTSCNNRPLNEVIKTYKISVGMNPLLFASHDKEDLKSCKERPE